MCCSFVNISYFGIKFLQYTLNILYFEICLKKINFLKPEHETASLRRVSTLNCDLIFESQLKNSYFRVKKKSISNFNALDCNKLIWKKKQQKFREFKLEFLLMKKVFGKIDSWRRHSGKKPHEIRQSSILFEHIYNKQK